MKIPRHLFIAASGWGSRVVAAGAQILLIRLLVQKLGADQYAAYAVLGSLSGWFLLADFGLGFSLQNVISENRARGAAYGQLLKRVMTIAIALLVVEMLCLILIAPWAGSSLLRQFPFLGESQKWVVFLSASVLFLLASVGQIAYKIWYGEQKGYLSNMVPVLGQLIGLGAVAITIRLGGHLVGVILANLTPPAILGLVCLVKLWMEHTGEQVSSREEIKPLLRKALGFGGFGFASAAVLLVDLPIISQFLPPRQIASYAVMSRIFSFSFMIYSTALLALWPVCSEHLALDDWRPVKRYVRSYILGGSVFVAAFTLLLAFKTRLITSVLAPGAMLTVPIKVIAAFGLLYIVRVWTDTYAMVLLSRSRLMPLWVGTPFQAVVSVGLQLILIPRFGMQGAVWGLIASFLLTASWILPFSVVRMAKTSECRRELENEVIYMHSDV